MDSLGEYIWIIVIIISLFSSLFSNKKKKEEQQRRQREQTENERTVENRPSSRLEETLREIFGEEESVKTSSPSDSYTRSDGSETTWDPASEYEEYIEPKSSTNRILEQQKELQEKIARIQSRSSSRPEMISELSKSKVQNIGSNVRDSYKKRRIVSLLKSPDSIKDLIIAQEILNKPKALRD